MPRRLLVVVPAVASLVVAYALLGPGRARPVRAARVFAAASDDGVVKSARLVVAERNDGTERGLRGEVRVAWPAGETRVTTNDTGVVEVVFDPPAAFGDRISVTSGALVLADAPLTLGETTTSVTLSARGYGASTGSIHVVPFVSRGQLVPPFEDRMTIAFTDAHGEPVVARADVAIEGANCGGCGKDLPAAARDQFTLAPIADTIEVDVQARAADGAVGSFVGKLPTAMASLWVAADDDRVEVAAASPKAMAYLSLFDDTTRVGGVEVPLADHGDGFYRGSFAAPPGARFALAASDERESGRTAAVFPIERFAVDGPLPGARAFARLTKAADGFGVAVARETRRASWVHRIVGAFVVCASLVQIVLMGVVARRSRRDLHVHVAAQEGAEPLAEPARNAVLIVVVVATLVGLAAAALVALSVVAP